MSTATEIPVFTTARLCLRGVVLADAESYERNFVDYEVIRFLSSVVPWPYPAGGVRRHLQTDVLPQQGLERWVWAITLKADCREVIGTVDLWRQGKPENRGFWLAKQHWGKGLMSEAVRPVTDYAFETLGFEQLILNNAVGNRRSRRIKEKTGARFLRTMPADFVDPALTETEIWQLSKDDWRRAREG